MSDQTNINQPNDSQRENNQVNILVKLADISVSLATNAEVVNNMKGNISEIKSDIKDIKTRYINFEQHKVLCDSNVDHETRLRVIETNITRILTWGSAAVLAMAILEFVINKYL